MTKANSPDGKNTSFSENQKRYKTLDSVDLSDIAQAIDGSKSISSDAEPILKTKKSRPILSFNKFWSR